MDVEKLQVKIEADASSLKNEVNTSTRLLNKLGNIFGKVQATFSKPITINSKRYDAQIAALRDKIADTTAYMESDWGKADLGTEGVRKMQAQVEQLQNRLEDLKSKQLKSIYDAPAVDLAAPFKTAFKSIGNLGKQVFKNIGSVLKRSLMLPIDLVRNKWNSLGSNNGFLDQIKRAGFSLFRIRGIFGAISKAAGTWLSYNDQINSQINAIWYALGSLLAPAIQFIVAIVERLLGALNSILRSIGLAGISMKGFARSTGHAAKEMKQLASFDEINNLNSNEDMGGGLGDLGKLDLSKKFKLPDVSWLSDLLDKLINWLPMFQKLMEQAANAINNFTDWLLRSFEYIDKFGVSVKEKVAILAEGIADGFNHLVDLVNWTQLGQALGAGIDLALQFAVSFMERFNFKNLGTAFSNAINGFVEKIDATNLGKFLVAKFNAIVDFASGAISGLNWNQISEKISDTLNSMIENIDLVQAAKNLSDFGKNLFNTITESVRNTNWKDLGVTIGEAIRNLDIVEVINSLLEMAIAIAEGFATSINNAFAQIDIQTAVYNLVQNLLNGLKDIAPSIWSAGYNIIMGLLQGIGAAAVGIFSWLKSNVVDPIINGIKSLFGIASPSTVMKAIGEDLVNGLMLGVQNVWEKIKAPFEAAGKNISTVWTNVKTAASNKWAEIKESVSGVAGKIKEGVTSRWDSIKTNTSNSFSNIKTTMSSAWQGMSASVKTYCSTIVTTVGNMVSAVTGLIGQIRSSVSNLDGYLSSMSSKSFNFSFSGLPSFDVGTNYVPHDMVAQIHKGEAIVPAKYNNGSFGGNNEETNSLLRELINIIEAKDLNVRISQNDIGRSAVKYISQQSRINGGALI